MIWNSTNNSKISFTMRDLNRIYLNFSVGIFSEKEKKSLLYRLLVMNC